MAKLVVLYTKPEDTAGFDEHYLNTHVPLCRAVPGATWAVTRMTGTPRGGEPAYYLMAEATFGNDEALALALRSDEMRATGRDAAQIVARFGTEATMLVGTDFL
jgi:uncharacterized protein (TIGR02118 family)